mgnify:CR=1 FL=1
MAGCGKCGALIDETCDPPGRRRVCVCGATARIFAVELVESTVARDGLGFKHKRPGVKKPLSEGFRRSETYYKTGEIVERQMLVDRQNNRYFESVIVYRTGEVVHFCDEKLTDHIDRGSAKSKTASMGSLKTDHDSRDDSG